MTVVTARPHSLSQQAATSAAPPVRWRRSQNPTSHSLSSPVSTASYAAESGARSRGDKMPAAASMGSQCCTVRRDVSAAQLGSLNRGGTCSTSCSNRTTPGKSVVAAMWPSAPQHSSVLKAHNMVLAAASSFVSRWSARQGGWTAFISGNTEFLNLASRAFMPPSRVATRAAITTAAIASRRIDDLQRLSYSEIPTSAGVSSSPPQIDFPQEGREWSTAPATESSEEADSLLQPSRRNGVPVFVMLPLDTVWVIEKDGNLVSQLKREQSLDRGLETLRKAGVEGVMVDVWWGLTERNPKEYDFSAYEALFEKIRSKGLLVQAVMSFHAAGGNVGDTCQIPLPQWVMEIGENDPDIWYTDMSGMRNHECLSLGCDELPIFQGRTPVQIYHDFISAFSDNFHGIFGDCITEITVGLGPAGELRYPSYPEGDGRWRFPGVGEFQCYDKYMLADLKKAADAVGHPEWGLSGPHDAGHYNSKSWETGFFNSESGNWNSAYGAFFLSWYSGLLIKHADRMLATANAAITRPGMKRVRSGTRITDDGHKLLEFAPATCLGAKLAGVHWWYKSTSHAAELTAGYYNTRDRCGYQDFMCLANMHGCRLHFTCVEMRDCEHPHDGRCSPEGLLAQMIDAAEKMDVPLAGENALQRYDYHAFQRITHSAFGQSASEGRLVQVTFLRMGDLMFDNWAAFLEFLNSMRGDSYR